MEKFIFCAVSNWKVFMTIKKNVSLKDVTKVHSHISPFTGESAPGNVKKLNLTYQRK